MKLKKQTPASARKQKNNKYDYDNSTFIQCVKLLKIFKKTDQQSTFQLRKLGIIHTAGRVMNLRERCYDIKTYFIYEPDDGVFHRIGLYIY